MVVKPKWIVVVGSVVDGLSFDGPFDDNEDAITYAEREYNNRDWLVVRLFSPNDDGPPG